MRKNRLIFTLIILAIFTFPSYSRAAMASISYQIPTAVIGGGGSSTSSTSFNTTSTVGQPTPILNNDTSMPQSLNYSNYPGFWYTLDAVIECPDIGTFADSYGHVYPDENYNLGCDFDRDLDVDGEDLADF